MFYPGKKSLNDSGYLDRILGSQRDMVQHFLKRWNKRTQLRILHLTKLPFRNEEGGNTHSDKGKRKGLRAATLLCKEGIPLNRKSGKSLGPAGREREELKKQKSGSRYFGALSQRVRMAALKLPCREPHEDRKMEKGEFQCSLSACYSHLLRMGGAIILDSLTSSADPWKRRSRGQRCSWRLWRSSCELLPTGAKDSVLPLLGTEFL